MARPDLSSRVMKKQAPSLAGRAVLALVLMVGFYALALGLCVGLGALAWVDLESKHVHVRLLLFCGITIGIVLWSVLPRPIKFPDPGVRLREKDQPELFAMIHAVAKAAEQKSPREVFLVDDVNAFVAERGSVMGFGGSRVLGIGLPLLQVLTVPQLRSVIAHEFGHFHGGDTKLGPFLYRTRDAIGRTITNFRAAESLLHKPFEWYGKLFLRVTFAISRAQEFAADALSVRLVGKEPMQSALRRVNQVGPLYGYYLQHELLPMLNLGARPPIAQGFGMYLGSKAMQDVQVEFGEQAMQAKGNPYDTHPPLSQRIAAAEDVDAPGAARSEGSLAITLLKDLAGLEAELLAFLVGKQDVKQLPAGSWQEVQGPALARQWAVFAAGDGSKLPPMRVAEFGAQRESLPVHAAKVNGNIPVDERIAAGQWMLGALLANALHKGGFAVVTSPGEPILLVRGSVTLEPFALARQLAEGKLEDGMWRAACEEHGIGDLALVGSANAA
jgi:heat shock protein HtpX